MTTNIEVELEPGLQNYRLPVLGSPEAIAEAVRHSWDLLSIAPTRIIGPLLAAAYAGPLSEIVTPDFVLWLYGGTGSYKSTVAALTLSHYGDFSETSLPLSFESTSNALERSLFLLKDVLTVIDDWRPGVTRADSDDMDRKGQRTLRGTGNRSGRGRMTSDTTLRRSYPPRGVVAVTAEALPEGPAFQSAAARSISIALSRADVDLEALSEMQKNKKVLTMAMVGYVRYVAECYDRLTKELPARRERLRATLRADLPGSHPRTPDNAAALIVALQVLTDFTVHAGAMGKEQAKEAYEEAKNGVLEAAKAHTENTSGGDPATRFIEILRSLLGAGRAYVKDRDNGKEPPGFTRLGWEKSQSKSSENTECWPVMKAEFVGWADDDYLYLDKDAAYAAVASFSQRGGIPFGIKPRALWEAMARSGLSLADPKRNDTTARIEGRPKRIVQVRREIVLEEG